MAGEELGDFIYRSTMEPRAIHMARELVRSHSDKFLGVKFKGAKVPLVSSKVSCREIPVTIKIPKGIDVPKFMKELAVVLDSDPVVEDVVQAALKLAGSPEERARIRSKVAELKATDPDWQSRR